MIASVYGEVIEKDENSLVVEVNNIGLKIYTTTQVCGQSNIGKTIRLYTSLVVREDNLTLFGFGNQEERDMFQQLIKVNGVGPRIALAILSNLTVEKVYKAVLEEKSQLFNQVPGIGSKTSQKLVLMLHDKFKDLGKERILSGFHDIQTELLEALTGLGYSIVEAQTAIQSLPKDAPEDLEEKIRLALRYFSEN